MDLENQTILAILTDFPLNAIHPPVQIYEDDKFICFIRQYLCLLLFEQTMKYARQLFVTWSNSCIIVLHVRFKELSDESEKSMVIINLTNI